MNITTNFPPYPVYKSSGVEWLGDVPAHWEVLNLRSVLTSTTERNRPDLPLLSVVREKGVILRDVDNMDENHNFIPEDLTNYKVVHKNQFAMNKMKAWQGSYGVSEFEGIVSPAYFTFDIREVTGDYFHKAIRSKAYVPFFAQASDGVRIGQWDLSQSQMKEIPFAVPPLAEQRAIVCYLDHVDRRIQRYIEAKEKLITLLQEARQAMIQRAVTRGLDPSVPLKPSGVDWLGDVPAHWEVRRLRTLGEAIIGLTYSPQDVVDEDEGTLVLRASNISEGRIVYGDNVYVRCSVPDRLVAQVGDILICSRSGSRALIGKNARIDSALSGSTFGAFMTIFRSEHNDYLHCIFNSKLFEYQSGAFLTSTINQLTLGILNNFKIPWPPLAEQKEIAAYVDKATTGIDAAIDNARRQVERMREYRASLIAHVVTGKLDVRAAAEHLPQESLELAVS